MLKTIYSFDNALFCAFSVFGRSSFSVFLERVRCVCVGKDKAQITVTLAVSEEGEVLPPQLIFGGKTHRVYPTVPAPCNGYYTHTVSHWQTPETTIEYIDKILVPYRQKVITEHNLPFDQ